jgi:Protein of unknown function (DUF1403)
MSFCAEASEIDAEMLALWIADVALASRLGWPHPVPLLAVVLLHPSLKRGAGGRRPRPLDEDWAHTVASVYGLAAAEAHALASDLARRAMRLGAAASVTLPRELEPERQRERSQRQCLSLRLSDKSSYLKGRRSSGSRRSARSFCSIARTSSACAASGDGITPLT